VYHKGYIEEDQFVRWTRTMPKESLTRILEFHIIPLPINDEAHRQFTADSEPAPSEVRNMGAIEYKTKLRPTLKIFLSPISLPTEKNQDQKV